MRLLHARDIEFKVFHKQPPAYAILSHRWSESEPSLRDIERHRDNPLKAHHKVHKFAQYIKSHLPQLDWLWLDSCCIDQTNSAELSEAVNRMFAWYRDATVCIAYLSDVDHPTDQLAFRKSVWFKRGWTLQELLASTVVIFVTATWQVIGHKGNPTHFEGGLEVGPNLESVISEITKVPHDVLQDFSTSHALSIDQRMRWMDGRETLREEDLSYALFGIFDVSPGANYGQGRSRAADRLRKAIEQKQCADSGFAANVTAPQSPPPRLCIPFPRDPVFVERSEMRVIQQKLSGPGARVALVGLGGIGKSQLAIEHCYRTMDTTSNIWVLWLHASSATRFDQEVIRLADDLDISSRQDNSANIFQLFRNWLNDPGRQWLVVLDNADDADFLFEAPESRNQRSGNRARIDHFPVCPQGSLLVTTRRGAIARRLTDSKHIIHLRPEQELAIKLLQTKLELTEASEAIVKLTTSLDCIPLAMAQAATYIKKKTPRCTVEDYLKKLEKSERSKSSLLNAQSEELRRDRQEAQNSILLTWQISFEHVRASRPSAADLLSLMSFYDHQGMPDFLLKGDPPTADAHDHDSDNSSQYNTEEAFEEDIAMLRDYSFISVATDKSILQMHRLVQVAAQAWLSKTTTLYRQVQALSLHKLNARYPEAHFEQWKQCQILHIHAKRMYNFKVENADAILALSAIMYKAAWFAKDQGMFSEAETLVSRSLRDRERILGTEHRDTLTSMDLLVIVYFEQGRYTNAKRLGIEVMETTKRVLGEGHPDTLRSMSNLALTYQYQGRYDDAKRLGIEVMETRKRVLGEGHPDTLISMGNLALTYQYQGRYDDAERLETEEMETTKRVLGEGHPDTLISMSNLALTYQYQGRYDDAKRLGIEVMETRKRVLGEGHPDTLISMNNLASTYRYQGRYDDAKRLGIEEMETTKRVLGEGHPDTLISMSNLALTYQYQGRYDDAERLETEVIETRKRVLGEGHPDTLISMNNLASTFFSQNRLQEAWVLMKQCLESRTVALGGTHPDTLASAEWLSIMEEKIEGRGHEDMRT